MLGSRIWTWYTQYSAALQQAIGMSSNDVDANVRPIYQFSEDWEVLGPFQTGTRGMAGAVNYNVLSSRRLQKQYGVPTHWSCTAAFALLSIASKQLSKAP